jgi:uncharacterized protein YecE (DUF72 family)
MPQASRRRPILVGTSGFSYPAWKGTFYPAKLPGNRMLAHYASVFRTVEINLTFRSTPTAALLADWRRATPAGFRFACKAPQAITHHRRLGGDAQSHAAAFSALLVGLGTQRGPILCQLPPNLKADVPRLDAFLGGLPPDTGLAFEFRHPSWFSDDTFATLARHRASLCIADAETLTTPVVATAPIGYLRLRRDDYAPADLARWAAIAQGTRGWQRVYVYFKHEDEGRGPRFAEQFVAQLG